MSFTIDLTGVDAWTGGAVLPPGRFQVICVDGGESRSSNGHDQIELHWEAIDGEHQGGRIRDWLTLSQNALGRVVQVMNACAIPIPDGAFSIDATLFARHRCEILVREKPKPDGSMRSEVVAYSPAGQTPPPTPGRSPAGIGSDIPSGFSTGRDDDIPFLAPEIPDTWRQTSWSPFA